MVNNKMTDYQNYALLQKIEINSRRHKNYFYLNTHNTDLHENTKFFVYKILRKLGFDVWVEAKLIQSKGIPDVIAIKDKKAFIIEVLHSESIKLGKKSNPKKIKYPSEFEFLELHTNQDTNEIIKKLVDFIS